MIERRLLKIRFIQLFSGNKADLKTFGKYTQRIFYCQIEDLLSRWQKGCFVVLDSFYAG